MPLKAPPPRVPLGLVAGNGELPIRFAREARRRLHPVYIAGVEGEAPVSLRKYGTETRFFSVGQIGSLIAFFQKHRVRYAVMEGQVGIEHLFKTLFVPGKVDLTTAALYLRQKDRSGTALMRAVANEVTRRGTFFLDCRTFLEDLLPEEGCLTRVKPTREGVESIRYGLPQVRLFAKWDVGQTLVVKRNSVVAVEAAEGTDAAILRGGRLGRSGTVVLKAASPTHDWRFDVPTIGPPTVKALIKAKAAGLVVEAGAAFLIRRAETVALADKHRIFIQAVKRP